MALIALAIVFALFVWWFSTGAILMLVRMDAPARAAAMAGATVLAALAVWGLWATRSTVTPAGALAGFTYGIVIWAWLEMSFLFGYVTGPRRDPMTPGAGGGRRFREAFATLSHHELAILATGLGLVALTRGAANEVGTWTFLVLWAMRISAKLNLFMGAPRVSTEFLPAHLSYLASYFARGRAGLFFHVSVTLASLCCGIAIHAAATAPDPYGAVAMTLIATLLALAVIEHWFLVLPVADTALWRWAMRKDAPRSQEPAPGAAMAAPALVSLSSPVLRRAVVDASRGPAVPDPAGPPLLALPRRAR